MNTGSFFIWTASATRKSFISSLSCFSFNFLRISLACFLSFSFGAITDGGRLTSTELAMMGLPVLFFPIKSFTNLLPRSLENRSELPLLFLIRSLPMVGSSSLFMDLMASLAELMPFVVEETPPSSSAWEFELFVERSLSDEDPTSGCVELTGDTCWDLPTWPLLALSPTCGNFGLEVVLLASPFSTLLFTAGAAAADAAAAAAAAADVEVVGFMLAMVLVVDAERLLELLVAFEAEAVGLMVGVTVADGFVDAGRVCLTSTNGLIGVVVVEVPATFGRGVSAD